MATLLSVNVGLPRDVAWNGRTVRTGIWKRPVTGPVPARRLNLDGDGQGDLEGHGGEQRAVMVYQAESYEHWRRFLHRSDLTWGVFGENFTVDGLSDDAVCIGDRYRIGTAQFEVTQPRTTCYRVGLRLDEPQMPALLVAHGRPGFYFRVLREGHVQAGDEIVKISDGPQRVSVEAADALLYLPDGDVATMRRLLQVAALSPGWRGSFLDLVNRAESPAAPRDKSLEPAWQGFRSMRALRIVHETDAVTSVYLGPESGGPLPPSLPGQYLTLRLPRAGDPPAVRSYSLSGSAVDSYRITVKREAHGVASSYIGTRLVAGDDVEVAAPRGEFVLDEGDGPVILLSAGIGLTPVLSMLHALAAERTRREVWWVHTTRGPASHAFADEARRLVDVLPNGHSDVFYTSSDAGPAATGVHWGRLNRASLAALGMPSTAAAYVCGPPAFMDAMTAALTDLGLPPSRIHTEVFASLSAVNPGVVPSPRTAPHPPAEPGAGPMVTFARAGLTVPFDEGRASLLEMAEACDVPTRWACRTGVCHTCSTRLLSGRVFYAPTPLMDPDPGEVLLCCARPDGPVVLDL
jgi:ferredoxin-NADP reductase/MOSC domain-containing protein YiiM